MKKDNRLMMKVLLFGASGQIGTDCLKEAHKRNISVVAPPREETDFTLPETIYNAVVQHRPSLVLNAAAYTNVDKAEDNPELALLVNTTSVGMIANACEKLKIPLIHLSSDYVFDGKALQPYKETARTAPLGVYGSTKEQGEKIALANCRQSIILRTSWIFGLNGENFVKTMLRLRQQRKSIKVVCDQSGRPTYSGHIAEAIFDLIDIYRHKKNFPWGIYHFADSPQTTWYEFACAIFQKSGDEGDNYPIVTPISSHQFPTKAKRPRYSVLDCHSIEQVLNRPMKQWLDRLEYMLEKYRSGDWK